MALLVVICDCDENSGGSSVRSQEGKPGAGPGPFAGLHQRPPIVRRIFFEEENFELAAGCLVDGTEPCGNDF